MDRSHTTVDSSLRELALPNGITVRRAARLLHVRQERIRRWIRAGLVVPADSSRSLTTLDFYQLAALRHLADLAAQGIPLRRVVKSVSRLRTWCGSDEQPITTLVARSDRHELLVRLDDGRLAELSGQTRLDFDHDNSVAVATPFVARLPSLDDYFATALLHEERHELVRAEEAYRTMLQLAEPQAVVTFNLANVLVSEGQFTAAAERFWQTVELDPLFVDAWNNLGATLLQLGLASQAIAPLSRAVRLGPTRDDAIFNLADALEQAGRSDEARQYWQALARLDAAGELGEYARARLEKSS